MSKIEHAPLFEPDPYPLNFNRLEKGDIIQGDIIADYYGIEVTDDKYWGRQLQFKALVEKRLSERGLEVTIVSEGNDLKILTDSEASRYLARQAKLDINRFERRVCAMANVDESKLTPEERVFHRQAGSLMQRQLVAINQIGRSYKVEGHKRSTPGLKELQGESGD